MKIKEIIVVEGRDDTAKVKQAVDADTIETNGSAVNNTVLKQIKHAKEKRGVIIFTDPDYPGKRIRHIVSDYVPGCKHAFLAEEKARSKHNRHKSLGIEHASVTDIQQALSKVYEVIEEEESELQYADLIRFGLIGGSHSKARRLKLGEKLHIGHTNGKQLLKRLKMFQITQLQFEQAMKDVIKEEDHV